MGEMNKIPNPNNPDFRYWLLPDSFKQCKNKSEFFDFVFDQVQIYYGDLSKRETWFELADRIKKSFNEWLEETEPPYVNRLSEIVGKWPGDESAEEIIEGIKGEPQTNEGVTEEMEIWRIFFFHSNLDEMESKLYEQQIHQQFIEPLQKQNERLTKELEMYKKQNP